MDTLEVIAERMERVADRYRAAGQEQLAKEALGIAHAVRQCSSLETAQGIEHAFNISHGLDGPGSFQRRGGFGGNHQNQPFTRTPNQVRVGGAVGWRNHNPGNLAYDSFSISLGAIGNAGGYAVFPDEATGQRAFRQFLQSNRYRSSRVIDVIQERWPSHYYDTQLYLNNIRMQSGIDPYLEMSMLNAMQMDALMFAMEAQYGAMPGDVYDNSSIDPPPFYADVLAGPPPIQAPPVMDSYNPGFQIDSGVTANMADAGVNAGFSDNS